jgi:RNA polymerase sigma factor (sigma-70 family)
VTRTGSLPAAPADTETLEELLEAVRPRLKKVLNVCEIPLQDAEDLLQETFLELLRKWDSVRHKDSWLVGTLRFKCSNYWRNRRAAPVEAFDLPDLDGMAPPRPPDQERAAILHDLRRLVGGLEDRDRAVLYLRFGLGLSTAEVALRLGYRSSSIGKLTGRCLARLRRLVDRPGPDSA